MKKQVMAILILIGVVIWESIFSIHCSASTMANAACRNLSISLSRNNAEPGEQISIQAQSNCSEIDGVALYYISARDATNWDQVCKWPGGWHTIGRVAPGKALSWTVPSEGEYYIVGNLLKSNGSTVCTGAFSWEPNQSCTTPKCIQGYTVLKAGYDMARYWNMTPGNYWIFEGYNYHMESPGRVRWEVEQKTDHCGKAAGGEPAYWPVRITKSSPYAYWGTAFTKQQAFTKEQANPHGSFFSAQRVEPGQGIANNTFSIQVKGTDSYSYPVGTSKVALYYISAQDAYNADKVCTWPGGWHTLGTQLSHQPIKA